MRGYVRETIAASQHRHDREAQEHSRTRARAKGQAGGQVRGVGSRLLRRPLTARQRAEVGTGGEVDGREGRVSSGGSLEAGPKSTPLGEGLQVRPLPQLALISKYLPAEPPPALVVEGRRVHRQRIQGGHYGHLVTC